MRWFNCLLIVVGIVTGPWMALADSGDDEATEGTTAGSTVDGVDFDIGDNVLGDPEGSGRVSSGTIESLTFLSGSADPLTITVNIINLALSFLGVISFVLMAYGGFKWFIARDNEEEVTKAKDIIKGTVIGLAITLTAMGTAQLIFTGVSQRTEVQTSWLVMPAYAEEEEPTYEPEELPFDPLLGSDSENVAVEDYSAGTIAQLDLGTADPLTIVVATVNGGLTLLGMIFMIMLIYAGVLWATARGNEEQIVKAKTILKRSVVGLIIVLSSYGLAQLIYYAIDFQAYGFPLGFT